MSCVQNSKTDGQRPRWAYNPSTNQLTTSGCAYDAAGNTTTDCSTAAAHTFQWDAEGRVSSVDSGKTYAFTYNAVGNRVQWANAGGAAQYMFDPAGNWLGVAGEYSVLWWRRTFLAAYEGSETYLNHLNGIGSTSMLTNQAGTPAEDMLFYPWGDVWQSWGTGGYNFANQPFYDTNTYTSPSMFRFYSMGLGRWLSPDPLGRDVTNPQSLNRYAYALNSPTTLTDPLGLNEADCNDPWYAEGHADCGLPPGNGTGTVGGAGAGGGAGGVDWAPGWGPPPTALSGTEVAAEVAQAEAAYDSWVSAMELWGGTYTEWGAEGPVTYTIGWSMSSGPFWIGPNGVVVNNQWAVEAGLPGLPGPQTGVGEPWGANPGGLPAGPQGSAGPQRNAGGLQIGRWNISHPSPEVCGDVKKWSIGLMVAGGGLLSVGTLLPVTAPVTYTLGIPAAAAGGVFGIYYAAFCRAW